jgi:proline dehydrogenase
MALISKCLVKVLSCLPAPFIKPFAKPYIAGESLQELLTTVKTLNQSGYLATVDLLGEFIRSEAEARQAVDGYVQALKGIQENALDANISVKLSQLGLLLNPQFCETMMEKLVTVAYEQNNFVRIDMEDSPCTDSTIALYLKLRKRHKNVGIVLQAMLRRTLDDAQYLIDAKAGHFRLCKGIYIESEKVAYQRDDVIRKNYCLILKKMFQQGAYVGIATHHEDLIWEARQLIKELGIPKDRYEFQMLLGVTPQLRQLLKEEGHRVRVYVPYGAHWHAYCMRRLKENPTILNHLIRNMWTGFKKKSDM